MTQHHCQFIQYKLKQSLETEDGEIPRGTHVLTPCTGCLGTPLEELEKMETEIEELNNALLEVDPVRSLYHWSPRARRKQILRYGFRPNMRPTTSSGLDWRAHYTCFADTPSWAWALSGGMSWTPEGEWDLWETNLYQLKDNRVVILPDEERPSGIYEVRVEGRIFKRQIWYAGSRVK